MLFNALIEAGYVFRMTIGSMDVDEKGVEKPFLANK